MPHVLRTRENAEKLNDRLSRIGKTRKLLWNCENFLALSFNFSGLLICKNKFLKQAFVCVVLSFIHEPSMADCCLIPQIYNARRFKVEMEKFPTILKIEQECLKMKEFQDSHPDQMPDAQK